MQAAEFTLWFPLSIIGHIINYHYDGLQPSRVGGHEQASVEEKALDRTLDLISLRPQSPSSLGSCFSPEDSDL